MDAVKVIEMQIQDLVVYGLGLLFLFILVVALSTIVRNMVNKAFKPKPIPNRREDVSSGPQHWTIQLVAGLAALTEKTDYLHGEMRDLNRYLRNGLSTDIREIKQSIKICEKRSAINK